LVFLFSQANRAADPGMKKDITLLAWPIVLLTNASVPDDIIYTVIKTLLEQQKELEKNTPGSKRGL